jgi:hypothetical protein
METPSIIKPRIGKNLRRTDPLRVNENAAAHRVNHLRPSSDAAHID